MFSMTYGRWTKIEIMRTQVIKHSTEIGSSLGKEGKEMRADCDDDDDDDDDGYDDADDDDDDDDRQQPWKGGRSN